jgi:hypothetical protein
VVGAPSRPWVAGGQRVGLVGVSSRGEVEAGEDCGEAGGRVALGSTGAEAQGRGWRRSRIPPIARLVTQ